MSAEQRAALRTLLRGTDAEPVIPFAQPRLADQGVRDRVGQGRRRQVVGHGQPRGRDGGRRAAGRHRRRRHLRLLDPPHARRHAAADAGRRHAAAARGVRRAGRLDRHVRAAGAAGRVARADAAPRAAAVPRRRVLGRPRRAPARPAARHRATSRSRSRSCCRAPSSSWSRRRRSPPPRSPSAPGRSPCRRGSTWSAWWRTCRGCEQPDGSRLELFGSGGGQRVADNLPRLTGGDVPLLGQVPLDVRLREAGDGGTPGGAVRAGLPRRAGAARASPGPWPPAVVASRGGRWASSPAAPLTTITRSTVRRTRPAC